MESAKVLLDKRTEEVLYAVVDCYINSGGPVGSRVVTKKYSFGFSPATIRNIMSDLEEMGFLRQPHTSAGRVPTDIGYRFYVDKIESGQDAYKDLLMDLNRKLDTIRKDINSFLDEASRMLSTMTHYIGITMSPNTSSTTLHRIELIKYKGNRVVVILFTDEGIIKNMIITSSSDISQRDLNRIAEYINKEYSGHTLDEIKKSIVREMSRDKVICDKLISEAVRICRDIFSVSTGNLYISGLSEMLDLPDFCDIDRIRELLKTIEDKHIIVNLLDRISEREGTQVFIGSENPLDKMKKFSLITATCRENNRPLGTIGIIGPTRMDYAKTITIVNMTASYISQVLSND